MADPRMQDASLCYLFVGNPGAGKSTLGNAKAGQLLFKSGASMGAGLTDTLDVKVLDGVAFVDTPGLADVELRKKASEAISTALKTGGIFKVVFVCLQDSGRCRVQDITTIQLVLQACEEIGTGMYGIIVNQVANPIMKKVAQKKDFDKFSATMQKSFERKTHFVIFVEKQEQLESLDDVLVPMTSFEGLGDFFDQLPKVTLTVGKALDIKDENFEKVEKMVEDQQKQIAKLLAKMEDMSEGHEEDRVLAQQQLQEMQAKHDKELEQANKIHPFVGAIGAIGDLVLEVLPFVGGPVGVAAAVAQKVIRKSSELQQPSPTAVSSRGYSQPAGAGNISLQPSKPTSSEATSSKATSSKATSSKPTSSEATSSKATSSKK